MSRQKSLYSLRGSIERALHAAKMEDFSFESHVSKPEVPLPKSEREVNAFIKRRTEMFRQNYLIVPLERALNKIKTRDERKRNDDSVSRAR